MWRWGLGGPTDTATRGVVKMKRPWTTDEHPTGSIGGPRPEDGAFLPAIYLKTFYSLDDRCRSCSFVY